MEMQRTLQVIHSLNYTEMPNDVQIAVTALVGVYRSKTGKISQLIEALTNIHEPVSIDRTYNFYYIVWRFKFKPVESNCGTKKSVLLIS